MVQMPSMKDIATTVSRQRKIANVPRMQPTELKDLVIPECFKAAYLGDKFVKFLQFDAGIDAAQNRFLLFASQQSLQALKYIQNVYSDGTFAVVPRLFQQLYTIYGSVNGKVLPLVYVLMPKRNQELYEAVLGKLKELVPEFRPTHVMTDLEQASMNAYQSIFPGITQKGCYFHLSQCIYRKLQKIPDVQKQYESNPTFARNCRMIGALAFVSPKDVTEAFEELENSDFIEENDNLRDLLFYFEINFIGKLTCKSRKNPIFPIS